MTKLIVAFHNFENTSIHYLSFAILPTCSVQYIQCIPSLCQSKLFTIDIAVSDGFSSVTISIIVQGSFPTSQETPRFSLHDGDISANEFYVFGSVRL